MRLLLALLAAAVLSPSRVDAQLADRPPPIKLEAVAAFAEEFFPREMAKREIPGAVFVLVANGKVAIARGFGFADLETRRPVDPERTLFRLASVSKVITATAALQLVERGQLDLSRDVNEYLRGFHLPRSPSGPITLHHLLTHTAGFDERLIGVASKDPVSTESLSAYLARSMPPSFTDPGRVLSYSNHGLALVGLLVEEASGRDFASHVREAILGPLGMSHSGFLIDRVPQDLAVAYEVDDGRHRPLAPDYLRVAPAGDFFTTGMDIARFLIAHLQGGTYEGARILREETVARMHARQFTQHPELSGWAYGFWEDVRTSRRAILHNGGGKGYRALIYLLPDEDVGFFLAYNLADKHEDGELLEAFTEHFRRAFVPAADRPAPRPLDPASMPQLAGDYRYVRRARTTMEKMIAVVNVAHVDAIDARTLLMTRSSDKPVRLTAMTPLLFRRDDGRGFVAFDTIEAGKARRLILDNGFPSVYERISVLTTMRVQAGWVLMMAAAFLYSSVWRPIKRAGLQAWISRALTSSSFKPQAPSSQAPSPRSPASIRWSTRLSGIASVLNLLFLVGFPLSFFGDLEGGTPEFIYGVPTLSLGLLIIPLVTTVLAMAATVLVVRMWREGGASLAVRLEHATIAASLWGFTAFAAYWRLLGVHA